jgi:hypothetical protein
VGATDDGDEEPVIHAGEDTYAVDALLRPGVLEAFSWGRIEGNL